MRPLLALSTRAGLRGALGLLALACIALGLGGAGLAWGGGEAGASCYALTLNVGSGSGTLDALPDSAGPCPNGEYSPGYNVTVVATAAGGYVFTGWSGTNNDSANPTLVTMSGDRKVTGYFAANCYALTLNVGSGNGTVDATPDSAGGCPDGQYPPGYNVTVVATAAGGYVFTGWSGTNNDGANPTLVTMTGNRKVTGYFSSNCYALTLNVGSGSGTIDAIPDSAGGCPNGQYTAGYNVTVVATAAGGYAFTGWSGTNNDGANPTLVTMNGNRKVTAYFGDGCHRLTVNIGSGSGTVHQKPSNAGSCPPGEYPPGYGVTLVATAAPGYAFSYWSGVEDPDGNPTVVHVGNADHKVSVFFTEAGDTPAPTPTFTPAPTFTPTRTPTSAPVPTGTPEPLDTPDSTPSPTSTSDPASTPPPSPTSTSAPTTTPPPGPTPTRAQPKGDVDCNGRVDAVDAAYILQYTVGLAALFPCWQKADVNNDGWFTAVDSALILQYVTGLIREL